jgi:hypothetical protein
MKSAAPGQPSSDVEVTNVSVHGFWMLVRDREVFLPFAQFPWFKDVSIGRLVNVELPQPHHLYWPDLDVDLHIDSIEHPEGYPLVSRGSPSKPVQRTGPRVTRPGKQGPRRASARR